MPYAVLETQPKPSPQRSRRTVEFHIYFAIIFLLAIPVCTERWLAHSLRRRTLNLRGPIARAWAEADSITPLIFSR